MAARQSVVVADGANLFYLQKKLARYLDKKYDPFCKRYYEAHKRDDHKKESFFVFLRKLGFSIVSKELKYILDLETGQKIPKGNFDVEITKDLLFECFYSPFDFSQIIMLSGDSDFAPLVRVLRDQFDKEVVVFSGRQSLSWELRLAASEVIYLEDMKKEIFRGNWELTKPKVGSIIKPLYRRRP